jgi:hypothetical protein
LQYLREVKRKIWFETSEEIHYENETKCSSDLTDKLLASLVIKAL